MKLRTRLVLYLGLTTTFALAGIYGLSTRSVLDGFVSIEEQRAHAEAERVSQGLASAVREVHAKASDWANWDDTHDFMASRDPEFLKANVYADAFRPMAIDLVAFLAADHGLIAEMAVPSLDGSQLSARALLLGLDRAGLLGRAAEDADGVSGILLSGSRPVAVSVRSVRRNDGGGDFRGWLLFARSLHAGASDSLRQVAEHQVEFSSPKDEAPAAARRSVLITHENAIDVLTRVQDIHGAHSIQVRTTIPRETYAYGKQVVSTVAWQLLAIGTLLFLVTLFVTERYAVARVCKLTGQVQRVRSSNQGGRVALAGRDELAGLAGAINGMLDQIDDDSTQLRKSEERLRLQNENLEQIVAERTREIEHQAFHDQLTSLPNRALFMDRVALALRRTQRSRAITGVLFIDLDNFKLVNDSLGHSVGDLLLTGVAERLVHAVRPGDTVARLGGDEFTVLLEDLGSADEASNVAQRILKALRKPVQAGDRETFACASIGVAVTADPELGADALLKNADTAMYRAKADGKSTFVFYDETMRDRVVERLEIETDLRRALVNRELSVAYQPIFDVATHTMVGAEALARWNHPTRGSIPPGQFIPVAEETGLILSIGYWVMGEACRAAKAWIDQLDDRPFVISVNLSARQLMRDDVVTQVRRVLKETGLPPERLQLEITESVLITDREGVVAKAVELRNLGVKLALDDFGTGYSSLSMLRTLPLDTLKIDRGFIVRLFEEEGASAIVEAIVHVARSLHIEVTGEGVETPTQEQFVKSVGVQSAQGYLYARPMAPEQFTQELGSAWVAKAS